MLVGKKVDTDTVKQYCTTPEKLLEFTVGLVPEPIKHVRAIVDNQRYYVATIVRNIAYIPYARRMSLCNYLLTGVVVCGVCNEIYDYTDLLHSVDENVWRRLDVE